MKRLFICTCFEFPYGDASSNYIRNLALSIKQQGWDVIVLGRGKRRDEDLTVNGYFFNGIQYDNVDISKAGAKNFFYLYFRYHVHLAPLFDKYQIGHNDYIYIFSEFLDIARYCKKKVPLDHITFSAVEWFQPFQFKYGRLDIRYLFWKYNFNYKTKRLNKVFPISVELERHYQEHGCRTCRLPALIDSDSELLLNDSNRQDGVTNFIYSGVGTRKDSVSCMIGAMYQMPEDVLSKMRLHFTSLTEGVLRRVLGDNAFQFDKVMSSVIFHGWLDYDDLIKLYRHMDYVLIARAKNKVTVSNFPSKIPEVMNYGVVPVCSDVGGLYTDLSFEPERLDIFRRS